jgi:putative drug exporter of the RND superfamily
VAAAARDAGVSDSGVAGPDAIAYDLFRYSTIDLATVAPVNLIVLAVLLGLLLRSIVAPLYLLATVALSYLTALGAASFVFIRLAADTGVNFLTRCSSSPSPCPRYRGLQHALDDARARGSAQTGYAAGTCPGSQPDGWKHHLRRAHSGWHLAVLAVAANSDQSRQLGFTIAFAVLVDSFFIRTLLVPSVAVVLGRWN